MTAGSARFSLVPLSKLRPHEEIDGDDVKRLADRIEEDGVVQNPVIVDEGTKVILDGHHRFSALERLECSLVPCHLVDYTDPSIQVERWDDGTPMAKVELVARALSGDLYPLKTSRHERMATLPARPTPLERLRPRRAGR